MSAKNTYMKFDYMRLSHMRVKWDEIRYIPICYQFFAGWEDLVLIIHIRTLRNVTIVVQERVFVLEDLVPICVNIWKKIILVLHRRYRNSYSQKQKKIRKGNDQEMGQSERNSHSINRGVGKTKMTLRYLYHENMS